LPENPPFVEVIFWTVLVDHKRAVLGLTIQVDVAKKNSQRGAGLRVRLELTLGR
jgi:hypothetical protein